MKTYYTLILFFTILSVNSYSQKGKLIYLEVGGNGIIETVNYKKTNLNISNSGSDGTGLRFGFGILPKYYQTPDSLKIIKRTTGNTFSFIAGYNYFFNYSHTGLSQNFVELGINGVIVTKSSIIDKWWSFKNSLRAYPSLNIGFRHQPLESKGMFWRISYCPFYISSGFKQWAGGAVGFSF